MEFQVKKMEFEVKPRVMLEYLSSVILDISVVSFTASSFIGLIGLGFFYVREF